MTKQAASPLRRRMIEDMTIRKFAQKTQHDYVQRVKDFAKFLGRSPDTAKPEDVRGFRLPLTANPVFSPVLPVNGSLHMAPLFPRSGPGESSSPMSQVC